ncbi:MAG: hypothetical protein UZ11_BCD004001890 [Bacteroidetes bacterium OLB11]|nr:MAG: hypothetical protein UZ11_BCD004001890 [Bacteroidetes bacterium OLB11]
MRMTFIFLLLNIQFSIFAQPFSAYTDLRQRFNVFDNGVVSSVEGLPPIDFKIGRTAVAYLDNQRVFKVFKDGMVNTVNDMMTSQFAVSDNLILYKSSNIISVIDGSDVVLLSRLCERYALGDSVVLFYDINRSSFNAYYQGKITELETFLNITDDDFSFDKNVKVSDNIGAYINYNGELKVFFNGESQVLESQRVQNFQVGRNMLAYVDINNMFKIFYNGHTFTIDPFAPKKFYGR